MACAEFVAAGDRVRQGRGFWRRREVRDSILQRAVFMEECPVALFRECRSMYALVELVLEFVFRFSFFSVGMVLRIAERTGMRFY